MEEQNYLGCEWNNKRLGDILEIMTGGTPSKNNDEYWSDGNIPWMVSGDINKGIINEVDGKITELGMNNSAAKLLPKDTVMIALNGQGKTKGKVAYLNIEVTCNQSLAGFLPNQEFNSKFLYYNLQNRYTEIRNLTGDGARNGLNLSILRDIYVLFPPLKQQKKIAEILSTIDLQIDNTDRLIEKTKELKKGLMQRLLTKGIGHSEFKKSEVGEIPVEWKVVKINDICEIVDYRGKTPQKVDKGIFLVTAKNIGKGYIDYTSSQEYIKESDYDSVMSRGTPEIGDVLFTTEAPLGNIANVDNINIALAQRVIKFRGDKDRLNNYYLKYYMLGERFQQDILHEATGSTVLGIKGSRLKNVLLAVPPLYEQEKIAHILTAVDNQISEYENEKIKLEELKKGLMQQLLTGKIRVV